MYDMCLDPLIEQAERPNVSDLICQNTSYVLSLT